MRMNQLGIKVHGRKRIKLTDRQVEVGIHSQDKGGVLWDETRETTTDKPQSALRNWGRKMRIEILS